MFLWIIPSAIAALALLAAGFWLYAMRPRTRNRPDWSVLERYDYAHRGFYEQDQSVPENSLAAFGRAVERGYGIELDVQLSADGEVVVCHDGDLVRMAGVNRKIRELTYAELKEIPLSRAFLGDAGERVPLFSDVLELVGGKTPLIVEVKNYGGYAELCEKTARLLDGYRGAYCIESFYPGAVAWFRKNRPAVVRGQLMCSFRGSEDLGPVKAFFARNLFSNLLTRPDFMAYRFEDRANRSLRVCRRLYGVREIDWTIRRREDLDRVKQDGALGIFEYFTPGKHWK